MSYTNNTTIHKILINVLRVSIGVLLSLSIYAIWKIGGSNIPLVVIITLVLIVNLAAWLGLEAIYIKKKKQNAVSETDH